MTEQQPQIEIRQMQASEAKTVLRVMRRAFPLFMQIFIPKSMVTSAEMVLVACVEDEIKAGVIMKTFELPGGGKGGVVDWIFTDLSGRGLGLGARLMDASMDWFEGAGCEQFFAIVEGFNTNSSNLFARRGFSILSFQEQIQRFGFPGFLKVWLKTLHFFDLGHFLWGKPAQTRADSPAAQLGWALLLNLIIALLARLRAGGLSGSWAGLLSLPLWVLILLVLRSGLMMFSARKQRLNLRFRLWETGYLISFIVSIIYGAFIPIPGSLYPNQNEWRYYKLKPQFGKVALAGFLPAYVVTLALFTAGRLLDFSGGLDAFLATGFSTAFVFSVLDLVPFFPLVSYNGRRIWDWKPWVWVLLTGVFVMMWVLMIMGV